MAANESNTSVCEIDATAPILHSPTHLVSSNFYPILLPNLAEI